MRIAFVTDVHFGPLGTFAGKLRKLTHLAGPLLTEVVEHLNTTAHPDLVVNLGDVVQDANRAQDREEYARYLALLGQVQAPVLHVAGNHDTIHMTPDDLRELWQHAGPLHYSRDIGGVHCVVLHTVETTGVRVHLPEEQLDWLARDLAAAPHPALVFVHHPLADMSLVGNRWFEKYPHLCLVENRRQVRAVLEASGKVVAVFNGHAHWHHADVIAGIPYVTLQSLTENLDEDAPGRPARAFALAQITREELALRVHGAEPWQGTYALSPPRAP